MREIKFRAWHKRLKQMFQVGELHFAPDEGGIVCGDGYYAIKDKIELMQYTGHSDKNGKDIYEGDIVRFKCDDFSGKEFNVTYVVKWGLQGFNLYNRDGKILTHYLIVIGNIYQDSHLLKNQKDKNPELVKKC
jgi:uncharacterized phage protein (TIGR01671 family)